MALKITHIEQLRSHALESLTLESIEERFIREHEDFKKQIVNQWKKIAHENPDEELIEAFDKLCEHAFVQCPSLMSDKTFRIIETLCRKEILRLRSILEML